MKVISSVQNSVGIFTDSYRYLKMSRHQVHELTLLKTLWANEILSRLKVQVQQIGTPSNEPQILFVGNHISYLDIPVLMSQVKDVSFVAKIELQRWPVFGAAAEKANTIFVKRENNGSRKAAKETIEKSLVDRMRVALFPSGTTSMNEAKPWRKGAFEIAQKTNSYIQPFRITYKPLRAVAYIDQDFFPTHLYKLCYYDQIETKIEFHDPVKVTDPEQDAVKWQNWSKGIAHD